MARRRSRFTQEGWGLSGELAHAPGYRPAAQAVPAECHRLARLDAGLGLASLDDHSMKPLIFLCVVTGAALVYLMSEASSNTALFAQNYPLLLGLGGGL